MLRTERGMDIPRFLGLLEEWKGEDPWCIIAKRCGVDRTVISRIKSGEYKPGYRTTMKLAHIAPPDYREKLYAELLEAAGLGGPYCFMREDGLPCGKQQER